MRHRVYAVFFVLLFAGIASVLAWHAPPAEASGPIVCAQWGDSTSGSPPVGFIVIEMPLADAISGDLAELYRVASEDPVTSIASGPIPYQSGQCLAVVVGLNQ